MEVVDARARRVLAEVVDHARTETGWLLFHVALTGAVVWLAVHGIDGVPSVLFWVLAGAVGSDALNSVGSTVAAWRERRRLRSCVRCVNLAADQDEAYELGRRCGRAGHGQVAHRRSPNGSTTTRGGGQ